MRSIENFHSKRADNAMRVDKASAGRQGWALPPTGPRNDERKGSGNGSAYFVAALESGGFFAAEARGGGARHDGERVRGEDAEDALQEPRSLASILSQIRGSAACPEQLRSLL